MNYISKRFAMAMAMGLAIFRGCSKSWIIYRNWALRPSGCCLSIHRPCAMMAMILPITTPSTHRTATLQQFKTLLKEAHQPQPESDYRAGYQPLVRSAPLVSAGPQSTKGSPERDYYVWTDDPTQYKDVRIIFQDFETSNWTWDHEAQQYYWHRFFHHQPDLNYDNPLVQDEVFKMIDYWCELGVDGFRLDAVPYLFEREGTNGENLPETHAFLKKLRTHVDDAFSGRRVPGRSQYVARRFGFVFWRWRRVPHELPFPGDAPHVHGAANGRPVSPLPTFSTRRPLFPTTASGLFFCVTTTS